MSSSRAPGFIARARAFAVADRDATIELGLDRDDDRTRLDAGATVGLPEAQAHALVDTIAELADVDQIVLVGASDRHGGEALLVQRCAGVPSRCTAVVELGYGARDGIGEAARSAWHAVRSADLRYPPSVLADPRLQGDTIVVHHCELCRSPWVWGGVSAVVVASLITIVAVTSESKPPPVVGVNPAQFFKP